jgi:hypothetical protein
MRILKHIVVHRPIWRRLIAAMPDARSTTNTSNLRLRHGSRSRGWYILEVEVTAGKKN